MDRISLHGNLGVRLSMTVLGVVFFLANSVCGLTFNDPERSYVLYNPPWMPSGEIQAISLQFRTVTSNALLFAHHYMRDNETKYNFEVDKYAVILQVISGRIRATHYYETVVESITAGERVSDDQWHTMEFSISPETGVMSLTVDGQTSVLTLRAYQHLGARNGLTNKFGDAPSAVVYLGGKGSASWLPWR
ncbi:axotactin-like [Diadema antillarum]|uniref:axotactin-like n=1 Tax=Diadema antillarum TaxID=105358 RepID=UPI003A86E436